MTASIDSVEADLQALVQREAAIDGAACLLRVELPSVPHVWRLAGGGIVRGGEPAHPDTPFRVASITKTFTAVVITQLAAEGKLKFDDLMTRHLPPDFADIVPRIHMLDGVSYGEQITIRQLLTHSAGLFDYAMSAGFFGRIAENPAHEWTPRQMLEGAVVWGTPHFPPGGGYGYAYSDTGYVLLGVIIEHLDGRSLHEAYRARILDPLGMHGTYLEGHEAHRGPEMSHPYHADIDVAPIHGTADWAGGGLVSTCDELATFAQALVHGRLVGGQWAEEMLEWRFRTLDPALHSPGYLGYGFGVEARDYEGFLLRGHRGHWGAWMHVDPVSGLTVTGTINQAERRPDAIVREACAVIRRSGLVPA